MLDKFVYACGQISIVLILSLILAVLSAYVKIVLKRQTKIKCLCHHEYEPDSAFYKFGGIEYTFRCRKCGKKRIVKTVVDNKFNQLKLMAKDTTMPVEDFIKYAKEEFGYCLTLEKSDDPDTFENLFGGPKDEETV